MAQSRYLRGPPSPQTIIFWPAHRYPLGRCTVKCWQRLTQHMRAAAASGHIIAAAGRYDAEYVRYFTGLEPVLLPTSALWYAGLGETNFSSARPEILVTPRKQRPPQHMAAMNAAGGGRYNFTQYSTLFQRGYTLQALADHRAMVLLPYAVLTYGLTELYALEVPIFVPTPGLLVELGTMVDTKLSDGPYCGGKLKPQPPHPSNVHPYSPEDRSPAALRYWFRVADYYQSPHVTQFSSWKDLVAKLDATNFDQVHRLMAAENLRREADLKARWREVLARVQRGGRVPASYEAALRDLWNTTQLQADR